jgi:Plavaka transposase
MLFKLPDQIQDMYKRQYDSAPNANVLTFLKRELVHAIWACLLTDDFVKAYVFGIVVLCADGVSRRLFPRFFTYSADYPEKCVCLILCSKSTTKFWAELFLPPSSTLVIACVHFVRVLRGKYETWVQRRIILDEIIFGWIQKCDKEWLQLHGSGYSRKGDQSLQK